jgi:MFS family permease
MRAPRPADYHVVHLGSAPSLADYCALAALVVVFDAYYVRRLMPRLGRRATIILVLPTVVFTALLLAIDPKHRYIFWWLQIGVAGPTILAATIHPLILLVQWRRKLGEVWPSEPKQQGLAGVAVVLVVASAAATALGTVLIANATQDLRLALAVSLLAALLLRLAWVLIGIRGLPASPNEPGASPPV